MLHRGDKYRTNPVLAHVDRYHNRPLEIKMRRTTLWIERWIVITPAWGKLSWRRKIGWWFRAIGEAIDGDRTFTLDGYVPPFVEEVDVWEALTHGLISTQVYLDDLARDRSYTGVDVPQSED